MGRGQPGAAGSITGNGQGGYGRRTFAQAAAERRALNTLCTVVGTQDFVFTASGLIKKHSCSEAVAYSKKMLLLMIKETKRSVLQFLCL